MLESAHTWVWLYRPCCVGFVHRVKNYRSRSVSSGWSFSFEIAETNLISITNELLGNLDEFLDFVGHVG